MKPVKAAKIVDKWLRSHFNFGFLQGYYQGPWRNEPFSIGIHFAKHEQGFLIYLSVYYPVTVGAAGINPDEIRVLSPKGLLGPIPSPLDLDSFWGLDDDSRMLDSLQMYLSSAFELICTPDRMIKFYKFLMGEEAFLPSPFERLDIHFVSKMPTANRLLGLACYYALCGDFVNARIVASRIAPHFQGEVEQKLLADCKRGYIHVDPARIDFLSKIGVKPAQSSVSLRTPEIEDTQETARGTSAG